MRLHSHEKPPTTFPFVLTNSCGLKMHGAVLHVTEEIDSQHVGGMVSQALNSSSAAAAAAGGEGGIGGQRGRTGAPLTPAQLPVWLRDTVRRGWKRALCFMAARVCFWCSVLVGRRVVGGVRLHTALPGEKRAAPRACVLLCCRAGLCLCVCVCARACVRALVLLCGQRGVDRAYGRLTAEKLFSGRSRRDANEHAF